MAAGGHAAIIDHVAVANLLSSPGDHAHLSAVAMNIHPDKH